MRIVCSAVEFHLFVESYSLLNSSFVLFDILFHLADFVVVPVPFENILQFCDPLGGGFSFHPDVSVFQFGVAHAVDAGVQPMDMYAAANDGEQEPEHAER